MPTHRPSVLRATAARRIAHPSGWVTRGLACIAAAGALGGCLPRFVLDVPEDAARDVRDSMADGTQTGDGGDAADGNSPVDAAGALDGPDVSQPPDAEDVLDVSEPVDSPADVPTVDVCSPNCMGRTCGPDGCGGVCGGPCSTGAVCNVATGQCVPPESCDRAHSLDPSAPSGVYVIHPPGWQPLAVYCDMVTDGGGWTVVSINGDLRAQQCVHVLSAGAQACGSVPGPTMDWQLSGNDMLSIQFTDVLFLAYDTDPATPAAATKVHFAFSLNVSTFAPQGTGGTAESVGPTLIGCEGSNPLLRGTIGQAQDGSTVFGYSNGGCAGSAGEGLGLDVGTFDAASGGYLYFNGGWTGDASNSGCYCVSTNPTTLSVLSGFFALR